MKNITDDCISRQAAIEEWKNDFKGYVNALNIPRDDYNGIMEYIDELPFAQPDRSCIDQIKWERDTAIQQLNELGYSFGEAIRHDKDAISRKGAINAVCTVLYPDADKMNDAKEVLKEMPLAQPEYYDYSDIEPLWKSFAEENDINLTDTAKQLKDAMWCGYRKGKADAQPEPSQVARDIADIIENEKDMRVIARSEIIRCKDCKHSRFFDPCFYCYELGGEIIVPENGFCFMAERRTDGQTC